MMDKGVAKDGRMSRSEGMEEKTISLTILIYGENVQPEPGNRCSGKESSR
jgi:hypothetical protein